MVNSGFTLLEVVITLFLLSIGFLGVASMQSVALQQSHNTYFRTQADLLLRDMAERMRNNPAGVHEGYYLHDGGPSGGDPQDCTGSNAACDAAVLAESDLADWTQRITDTRMLPEGRARIIALAQAGAYEISIYWHEKQTRHESELVSEEESCIRGEMLERSCLVLLLFVGD